MGVRKVSNTINGHRKKLRKIWWRQNGLGRQPRYKIGLREGTFCLGCPNKLNALLEKVRKGSRKQERGRNEVQTYGSTQPDLGTVVVAYGLWGLDWKIACTF